MSNAASSSALSQSLTFARFLRSVPAFVRNPLTLERARAAARERLARREENLVAMAEKMFFGLPSSPYLPLFDLAGCSLADFRDAVKRDGVEATLTQLREAGVYFTFEEYKGRTPVVRHGREIRIETSQFGNPFLNHYYRTSTSGSTGKPTPTQTDLAHLTKQAESRMLMLHAHGLMEQPFSIWRPALPSGSGINNVMRMARIGRPVDRWFTPMVPGGYTTPAKYRVATNAILTVGRLSGVRMPSPEPVPLGEAATIAEYLVDTVRRSGGACLNTTVSCGLRVALAARAVGASLEGVTLFVAGEPPTSTKVREMQAAGARVTTDYGASEMGRIGMGCACTEDVTDVHIMLDLVGVIAFPRHVPESGETVRSFHVTSLVPTMPLQLLNLELDDFGALERRDCGCAMGELGFDLHARGIRSFRKLVGEGVTLIGSDMVRILEEVLPQRFGGSALDYQLVEEEDEQGFTRLTLHVDPRLGELDPGAITDALLGELTTTSVAADMARAHWQAADSFRVVRRSPQVSARGKQASLRVASRGTSA